MRTGTNRRSLPARTGRALLYAAVMLVVVLVLLELSVRALGIAPGAAGGQARELVEDPHLPYRPKPNSVHEGRASTGEYDYRHVHNSYGFRDVEYPVGKPPGTFRILGLGDSFTMGWGAEFEETYLRRLETALNARPGGHPPVQVVKAGISGYFPESERLLLEHYGLDFEPDLVLVGFTPNDIYDQFRGIDAVRLTRQGYLAPGDAKHLGELGVWLYRHLHVSRIPLQAYFRSKRQRLGPNWAEDLYRDGGVFEETWNEIYDQFGRMIDLARSTGAELAVLYIPTPRPGEPFRRYPAERLGAWLAERGVPIIDATPALEAASEEETLYYAKDGHCTPAGYRVIAEVLFEELTARGLVP